MEMPQGTMLTLANELENNRKRDIRNALRKAYKLGYHQAVQDLARAGSQLAKEEIAGQQQQRPAKDFVARDRELPPLDMMGDRETPAHLLPDAPPTAQCDGCGRKVWDQLEAVEGRLCGMRQPDESSCTGRLRRMMLVYAGGGPHSAIEDTED